MLNFDLKKFDPKGRIKDRDSALLFYQQWGNQICSAFVKNPTDPQDPLSNNLAGLGLHRLKDHGVTGFSFF